MSRRNNASRRRAYGRRLRETRQRQDRQRAPATDWLGELDAGLEASASMPPPAAGSVEQDRVGT